MNKVAVITSSVGSNDLYNPTQFLETVDYHAFVDKTLVDVEDNWTRHHLPPFSVVDKEYVERRTAKLPKILPHCVVPGYEYYIWIDSTNKLAVDPQIIIDKFLQDSDIACFKHTKRSCVYEELLACLAYEIDNKQQLVDTFTFLSKNKFPKKYGLFENTCRIQRNTTTTQTMGFMWWEMICKMSSRDQLSLPYVLKQLSIKPSTIPGHAQGNNDYMPLWRRGTHKRRTSHT